jgi:hypothetical protein
LNTEGVSPVARVGAASVKRSTRAKSIGFVTNPERPTIENSASMGTDSVEKRKISNDPIAVTPAATRDAAEYGWMLPSFPPRIHPTNAASPKATGASAIAATAATMARTQNAPPQRMRCPAKEPRGTPTAVTSIAKTVIDRPAPEMEKL